MRKITIIGGGLAGLTLGIALRKAAVPVTLYEAGQYPRHKVCGEFLSGRGQDVIQTMGLNVTLRNAGANIARTGAMFFGKAHSPVRQFARPALCLSRYVMDETLALFFVELEGELVQRTRFARSSEFEGCVWATGRNAVPKEDGWHWFGLKGHVSGAALEADLEVHSVPNGYVGLCRIERGLINVCGLFRRKSGGSSIDPKTALLGCEDSTLQSRMQNAVFDESSICAVAGLSWRQRGKAEFCAIGDALCMVPPITGNGMSIAFETAALAAEPCVRYGCGEIDWPTALGAINRRCRGVFTGRFRWALWLHRAMMCSALSGTVGCIALRSQGIWDLFYARTRGENSRNWDREMATLSRLCNSN